MGSAVMGVFLRFEDDSVESAKQAMQWNVKIINVSVSLLFNIWAIIVSFLNISLATV